MGCKKEIRLDLEAERKGRSIKLTGTIYNQFAFSGKWLKGTLHCHLAPKRWQDDPRDFYSNLGYDFIPGMEHDEIIDYESRQDLLVIPGAEVTAGDHFLVFGVDNLPHIKEKGNRRSKAASMIRDVRGNGGIVIVCHPCKTGWTWQELELFCKSGLTGMEVVNSNVRGKIADAGRADQIWFQMLLQGNYLTAVGNDDAHGPHEDLSDSPWGGVSHVAWTGLLAENYSVEGILNAVRQGRTYASEGPEIRSVEFRPDGKLIVESSPCVACHFRSGTGYYGGASVFPDPKEKTGEKFIFDFSTHGYRVHDAIVVVLVDEFGRRAWLSPIRINLSISEL